VLTHSALTSPTQVLALDEPDSSEPWHSIGSMGFDPAGYMWLFHGDFTAPENAQDPASTLGKLLRFRPRASGGVDPVGSEHKAGFAPRLMRHACR
jgi:glucose/arabinose dehydrogenase